MSDQGGSKSGSPPCAQLILSGAAARPAAGASAGTVFTGSRLSWSLVGARRPLLSALEGRRQGDNQGTSAADEDILTCDCAGWESQDAQRKVMIKCQTDA